MKSSAFPFCCLFPIWFVFLFVIYLISWVVLHCHFFLLRTRIVFMMQIRLHEESFSPLFIQLLCHLVVSDSLRPHELQNTRLPCPPPTPRACSNSCPWSRWYHPPISSSVIPFSCLQSFPTSGFFQWASSLHHAAKVLVLQLQPQSFQWIFGTDIL